jgi:hypothetical protein
MNHQIINDWIKVYMIGPIEHTKSGDFGKGWREKLQPELQKRIDKNGNPLYVFNPLSEEQNKVGMEACDFHKKLKSWINSGNNDKVAEGTDLIWRGKTYIEKTDEGKAKLVKILGDNDYTINSTFLVARMEDGDVSCIGEHTLITMADYTQKEIKNISKGDKILGIKTINKITYFVPSEVYDILNKGKQFCHTFKGKFHTISCTFDHNFLRVSNKKANDFKPIKDIMKKDNKVFEIHHSKINKDFFMGWLKGYCFNDFNFKSNKHGVTATCVSDKEEEILKVQKILKMFNIESYIKKTISIKDNRIKNQKEFYYHLYITDKNNFRKLKNIVNCNLPRHSQKCGFITGAIDADGWYDEVYLKYTQSTINQKNYDLFIKILKDLNISYKSKFRTRKSNFGSKNKLYSCYEVSISKKHIFLFPSQFDYKRKLNSFTIKNATNFTNLIKQNYAYNTVYDLITETENFIANGFIVHNCGTFGESYLGFINKIPIYVLQTMPREKYPVTFVGWVFGSGGQFFNTQKELLEFIDEKYQLKIGQSI